MTDPNAPTLPSEGYVRLPVVLRVLPVGRTTFMKRVRSGVYPAPVKLGPRVNAWNVRDIRALLENLPAMPGAPAPKTAASSSIGKQEPADRKKAGRRAAA